MLYTTRNDVKVDSMSGGPETSFHYIFKAHTSGTFWYHSHVGTQRTDGLFGVLIIQERNMEEIHCNFLDEPEKYVIFGC